MVEINEKLRRARKDTYVKEIVFANHAPDGQEIALPSKKYLTLHAACCKVAAMSGAAEYIEKVYMDYEETDTLASDGRSAHVLADAVWRAVVYRGDDDSEVQA